ncbi:MAG: VWA domain-containing protein [Leptolyngbya sp. DLM2.Bin15]|nr:MAG: VWA domain-containing protein [Leptolyngbya sp. DLM2.Bin15]
MPVGFPEFIENPENRCPVILLLDTSASMAGASIEALNEGIQIFKQNLLEDEQASLSVDVAIITFGNQGVQCIQDFVGVHDFLPPTLQTGGMTPMGAAIDQALNLVETRKQVYRQNHVDYYRPWIFLITDGAPTDDWQAASTHVRSAEQQNKVSFFAVAVEGANLKVLRDIAPPHRPPISLHGLNFRELFVWLSASVKRVSGSKVGEAVALPAVGWGEVVS